MNSPEKESGQGLDPENQKQLTLAIAVVLAVLAAPLVPVVYGAWWLMSKVVSLRTRWVFAVAGLAAATWGVLAAMGVWSAASYGQVYPLAFTAITGDGALAPVVGALLAGQVVPAVVIASLGFAVMSWWKNRNKEVTRDGRRASFVQRRAAKKTRAQIEAGTHGPQAGTTLGVSMDLDTEAAGVKYGQRVVISDAEQAGHVLVVGGSGSGKTQSMLSNMRDAIRLGRGVVVIDCKGGPDVPAMAAEWAERYDRRFLHWSITNPDARYTGPGEAPAFYDPISRGDASRRKDLLVGSQKWDVEYYKSVIANYLQTVFRVIDLVPPLPGVDTFTDVADLLHPPALLHRAKNIDAMTHSQLTADLVRLTDLETQERSGIRSMYSRLHTLMASTAGAWLRKDPRGEMDIDLRRAADEGHVVVFSLDTSNYEETARLLAGLIIQDLKTLSSELRHDKAPAPMHVYVDEFSAVDSVNILGLLSKARDAQMPVMLATQALADLQRSEPTFVDQVLGIVSSFIIHRANTADDARTFAGLSGMRFKDEEAAYAGTSRAEEFTISLGDFQKLSMGQCVFIAKSPSSRMVNYVAVVPENPALPPSVREPGVASRPPRAPLVESDSPRVTYAHPNAHLIVSPSTSQEEMQQLPVDEMPIEPTVMREPPTSPPPSPASPAGSGPQRPTRPQRPVRAAQAPAPAVSSRAASSPGKPAGSPIPGLPTRKDDSE